VIQEKPFSGGRVAYFVDITPMRDVAVTQETREIHLQELDEILLTLARKSGSSEANETSALREVAALASSAWKRDRWELWILSGDRTLWTLGHLHYATPRRSEEATPEISVPQTGSYLRALDQARVLVTSDVKDDPDGHTLLGQGSIGPDAASRLDIPIRYRGKVVGALVIAHHTPRPWTQGEVLFAGSIGDRMSLLIETVRSEEAATAVEVEVPTALPPAAASTVDGFVHLDDKLRFTFLNPGALQWLEDRGVDGNALVGRALDEAMKGVRDRSIIAEVRKAIRGGGPARLRRQLERDGPWLDLYINPSATGVSVTLQNRARQKERQSERSLRDSETRFRSVVESLREGLVITDLNDRIVYVNSRITDLTGRRAEDLDGKKAQDLLFDTANWKDGDSRMSARRERKRTRYDAPLLGKDGKVLRVEVISTPLRDADGAVTGVVDAITAVEHEEGPRTASLAT
jgi:PAS domain S-box-containing protein